MLLKNLHKIKKNFSNSFMKLSFNLKNNIELCLSNNQKKFSSIKKNKNLFIKNKFKIQKRFYNFKINPYKNFQKISSKKNLTKQNLHQFSLQKNFLKTFLTKKQIKTHSQKPFQKQNQKKFKNLLKKILKTKPKLQKRLINEGYSQNIIAAWLLTTASIVLFMICLGGYTRLTKSGLSMTKWKPVNSKYPNSDKEWNNEFERYKETPEFIEGNPDISLSEFKKIFFVEYFHRSVGRFIGVVFGVPFLYFNYKGYFTKLMKKRLFFFFCLGGFQGLIGWWMVKSGFEKKPNYQSRPRVSTYRLLTHNSLALILYSSLLYNSLLLLTPLKYKASFQMLKDIKKIKKFSIILLHLIALNLLTGVTVAGIDAGKVFNTWPLMNGAIIPKNYWQQKKGFYNFFENCATVQFNHRFFAYLTYFTSLLFFFKMRKMVLPRPFFFAGKGLFFLVNFLSAPVIFKVNFWPSEKGQQRFKSFIG